MALTSMNELDSQTVLQVPLDVRGWEARTSLDNETVGKVHDVLFDEAGVARYLDLDLGIFRKHVLLPVGQAITDERRDLVWIQAMEKDGFDAIPEYGHEVDGVSVDFEHRLNTSYAGVMPARYDRPEFGGIGPGGVRRTDEEPTVMGTEQVRLRRLRDLDDYEVADHDPDPRGWTLVGSSGEPIGAVDELVVDPQALKTRYLEVELDRGVAEHDHVLIPVGYARLEEEDRRVRVDALDRADINTMPRYRDDFDEAYEDRIDRHFARRFEGSSLYRHPRYDVERFYGQRVVEHGYSSRPGTDRVCDVRLRH